MGSPSKRDGQKDSAEKAVAIAEGRTSTDSKVDGLAVQGKGGRARHVTALFARKTEAFAPAKETQSCRGMNARGRRRI